MLLNFGGPRSVAEVPRFLYEILRDPNAIQAPIPQALQNLLARQVARRRSREVARQYGEIGGSSPIVAATEALRQALQGALAAAGRDLPLFIAHRYLPGDCTRAAQAIVQAGVDALLAVPLYPHFCYATTGSSLEQLQAALDQAGYTGTLEALRSYPDAPGYVDALAERLQAVLQGGAEGAPLPPRETLILCSAHGLPAAYVERGDPYRLELYRTLNALRRRFPGWRFALSFQSRVGPAQWLEPYTDRLIPELAGQGHRHLVFLALSFVNDHLETLYEIGHTYFGLARRHGLAPHRVPAIEDHPAFVAHLATQAREWQDGLAGVPARELLPPAQSFLRRGFWVWSLWLAALVAALAAALLG